MRSEGFSLRLIGSPGSSVSDTAGALETGRRGLGELRVDVRAEFRDYHVSAAVDRIEETIRGSVPAAGQRFIEPESSP